MMPFFEINEDRLRLLAPISLAEVAMQERRDRQRLLKIRIYSAPDTILFPVFSMRYGD